MSVTGAVPILDMGSPDGGVPLALHVYQVSIRAPARACRLSLDMKELSDVVNTNKTKYHFQLMKVIEEG